MNVQWLLPTAHEVRVGAIICGTFYVVDKLESLRPFTVVRDRAMDYNVVRVDWTPEEVEMPTKERALIMDSVRMLAEIKYNQLKENNGSTL